MIEIVKMLALIACLTAVSFGQYRAYAVVAQEGDTIAMLATRHGVDPVGMAAFNGLLPNSKLTAGRHVNVPNETVLKQLCNLRTPPEIRGLRLGMEKQEIQVLMTDKMIELARMTEDSLALRTASNYSFRDRERFKGIWSLRFDYHDGKLSELEVQYERDVKWASDYEFVQVVGSNFGLPNDAWQMHAGEYVMPCDGFRIVVTLDKITLRDTIAEKAELKATKMAEEAKKKAFRP